MNPRSNLSLWLMVRQHYPYYKDLNIRNNIKYLSQSTMITDEEEQLLYNDFDNHHLFTVSNVGDGLECIRQIIYSVS